VERFEGGGEARDGREDDGVNIGGNGVDGDGREAVEASDDGGHEARVDAGWTLRGVGNHIRVGAGEGDGEVGHCEADVSPAGADGGDQDVEGLVIMVGEGEDGEDGGKQLERQGVDGGDGVHLVDGGEGCPTEYGDGKKEWVGLSDVMKLLIDTVK
jgi:hypothetical protein